MKKFYNIFAPKEILTKFDKIRFRSFIWIDLFGLLIVTLLFISNLFFKTANYKLSIITDLVMMFFLAGGLGILKFFGIKKAGIYLSVGFVFLAILPANIILSQEQLMMKYINGYYLFFPVLAITALFGNRKLLIINTLIFIIVIVRIFIYSKTHFPENTSYFTSAFTFELIAILVLAVLEYFILWNSENMIEISNKQSEQVNAQNAILRKLIKNVKVISQELLNAGEQLSGIAAQVANNSNEQATTTEEVASSMEEMLAMVTSSSTIATNTIEQTASSIEDLEKSKNILFELITTIQDIPEKINLISKIAAKTDILSINAAIEAAKAGDSGRGFAVVAQEIKKLSDQTKELSNEIIQFSKKAKSISDEAQNKLIGIVGKLTEDTSKLENIVTYTNEQIEGINNINISIQGLTTITNANSTNAEELSSSAEELVAQAQKLQNTVKEIKIADNI